MGWGYVYAWNWLSRYDDDAIISQNNKKLTAYEQDLHLISRVLTRE